MSLREKAEAVAEQFKRRSKNQSSASLLVKIILIVVGSAVATVAQFLDFNSSGPTHSQILGIIAAIAAGIGGIYVVVTDKDAAEELELARDAIESARELQYSLIESSSEFVRYQREVKRAVELYQMMSILRGVIEQVIASPLRDTLKIIDVCMEAAQRALPITMGFHQADRWTICVYHAEANDGGKVILKCVAHNRAIKCDLAEARTWAEGVGVSGVAYSNNREVIVPDLLDPGLGTVFDLGDKRKAYDDERYRSLAAVPISVDRAERPWGILIATSDRPHHFEVTEQPGVQTVEGVRALAGMLALAISVSKTAPRSAGKPPSLTAQQNPTQLHSHGGGTDV
jgi:hypothetical protein